MSKECILVKYFIYAVLRDFNFVLICALFPPNSNSQTFRVDKKMFFSRSGYGRCHILPSRI